jgi:uncharacterized membrane protein
MEPVMSFDSDRIKSLTTIGMVSYILHLIVAVAGVLPGAQMGVGLLIIAAVLDFIKRDDAVGTWHESHFNWRLHSVLIAGGLYLITAPLWLLFLLPGMIAWWMISIWFLYRIIKGMVRMNASRPIEN